MDGGSFGKLRLPSGTLEALWRPLGAGSGAGSGSAASAVDGPAPTRLHTAHARRHGRAGAPPLSAAAEVNLRQLFGSGFMGMNR